MSRNKQGILLAPARNSTIPKDALWLAGQGSGSWYQLQAAEGKEAVTIRRFSPEGRLEFSGEFKEIQNRLIDGESPFAFEYPSHFKRCTVVQNGQQFDFVNANITS